MKGLPLLLAAMACACKSPVMAADVEARANAKVPGLEPVVVESSAPVAPAWVKGAQHGEGERLGFVGLGEAPSLDLAQAQAKGDLLASISSYVALDVQAELQALESQQGGELVQRVRSVMRTQTSAALQGVAADAVYWERVLATPLATGDERTRCYAHAWVDREELRRARAERQARREKDTGRRVVAFLPLRAVADDAAAESAAALAGALGEQLAGRLAARPAVYVTDPAVVRGVLPADAAQRPPAELARRVGDALSSDLVVSGLVQQQGTRVRVTLVGEDSRAGRAVLLADEEGEARDLSALQSRLAKALAAKAAVTTPGAPPARETAAELPGRGLAPAPEEAALTARQKAWTLFDQGRAEEAIATMSRAVELAPRDIRTVLSMGRMLERAGRFARLPPTMTQPAREAAASIVVCTDAGQRAARRAAEQLEARATRLRAGARSAGAQAPWWDEKTLAVDAALELLALQQALDPDALAKQTLPAAPPGSAVEAYLRAHFLARGQRDARAEYEAELGVADLAVRVDRLEGALAIYQALLARGTQQGEWNLMSLAAYGQGLAERKRGNRVAALERLQFALVARSIIGEKPYLLEILSELAGVASELGRSKDAARWLDQALRIAEQLGNDYLRTVLANNRGVLEFRAGRLADATARFQLAVDRLAVLGESDGRIAAGLNLATAVERRGNAEEAQPILDGVGVLVEKSGQEGRLAELQAHRGALLATRGRNEESLEALATAFLLYRNLGRGVAAERLQAGFLAAERSLAQGDEETLACLARAFRAFGSPVFPSERGQRPVQTVADLPPGRLQPQDLVIALDAASLSALTPWRPPPSEGAETLAAPPAPAPKPPPPDALAERAREMLETVQGIRQARSLADAYARSLTGDAAASMPAEQEALGRQERAVEEFVAAWVAAALSADEAAMRKSHDAVAGPAGRLRSALGFVLRGGRPACIAKLREQAAASGGLDVEPPVIMHQPLSFVAEEDIFIQAWIGDASGIFAPTVHYRFTGGGSDRYVAVPMATSSDFYYATIIARSPGDLEYWIEVFDEYGNGPARSGSPDRPHRVVVIERPLPYPQVMPTDQQPAPAGPPSSRVVEDVVPVSEATSRATRPPLAPVEYKKPAAYDRILGAATLDADVLVLLNPADAPAVSRSRAAHARRMLDAIASHFLDLQLPREAAIARLDAGALAWMSGEHEEGFRIVLDARAKLASLGDVAGLAHAHEWLGYQLEQSGHAELAADDRALALSLYRLLGDEAGARRVLSFCKGGGALAKR